MEDAIEDRIIAAAHWLAFAGEELWRNRLKSFVREEFDLTAEQAARAIQRSHELRRANTDGS